MRFRWSFRLDKKMIEQNETFALSTRINLQYYSLSCLNFLIIAEKVDRSYSVNQSKLRVKIWNHEEISVNLIINLRLIDFVFFSHTLSRIVQNSLRFVYESLSDCKQTLANIYAHILHVTKTVDCMKLQCLCRLCRLEDLHRKTHLRMINSTNQMIDSSDF